MGIEPTYPAWKAGVLPLNYTRMRCMKLNTVEQKPLFLFECPVPESNQRHEDFQSSALPTELTGRLTGNYFTGKPLGCQEKSFVRILNF